MRKLSGFTAAMLASVITGTPVLAPGAETTSPGKETVHVSSSNLSLPGFQTTAIQTTLLTGTLARGKPHRALVVHGLLTSIGAGENAYILPRVNDVAFNPADDFGNGSGSGVNCPSTSTITCSASGTWWLDLDAAEAAHPGTFIGQPLVIELKGFTSLFNGIPGPLVAAMSAELEKK